MKRLDEKDISTKHLQKAGGYGNESIESKEDFQTKTSEKKNNMASKFVGNSFGQNDVDKLVSARLLIARESLVRIPFYFIFRLLLSNRIKTS